MIVFTHLKNNASNYFRVEAGGTSNHKYPNTLSNGDALLSLFLEYAQGNPRDPETGRLGEAP